MLRGASNTKKTLALFIALMALAFLFRAPIMQLSAMPLVSSDNNRLEKADAILVLGGGLDTRPFEGARLFKDGWAPLLLVTNEEPGPAAELGLGQSTFETTCDILTTTEQLPPENIILIGTDGFIKLSDMRTSAGGGANPKSRLASARELGHVTSTFDEANALKKWCEANRANSVIIVTNPLHSHRVRRIFTKILEQGMNNGAPGTKVSIRIATVECRKYTPLDWWKSEEGLIAFNNEWIKTAYYWFKY